MLSPEQIYQLKKEHGRIYSAEAGGIEYIFRAVSYKEYDELFLHRDWSSAEVEDALVEIVLLDPKSDFTQAPAGVVSQLSEEIRRVSGFSDARFMIDLMDEKRQTSSDTRTMMKAFVIAAMPSYTGKELDRCNFDELAEEVVLAEKIFQVQQAVQAGGEVTLELVDPDAEEAIEDMRRRKHASSKMPGQAGFDDPIAQRLNAALGG